MITVLELDFVLSQP